MRKVIIVAVLVGVLDVFLIGSYANAKEDTIQDLLAMCKYTQQIPKIPGRAYCLGMANGVQVAFRWVNDKNNKIGACFPPTKVTNGQVAQAFINWAERNPKVWDLAAAIGMILSIQETWPCKK